MTIEVRQMLIKSSVATDDRPSKGTARAEAGCQDMEQMKEDILAECKAWLKDKLNDIHER